MQRWSQVPLLPNSTAFPGTQRSMVLIDCWQSVGCKPIKQDGGLQLCSESLSRGWKPAGHRISSLASSLWQPKLVQEREQENLRSMQSKKLLNFFQPCRKGSNSVSKSCWTVFCIGVWHYGLDCIMLQRKKRRKTNPGAREMAQSGKCLP